MLSFGATLLTSLALSAPPASLSADTPEGTDLLVRVETGRISKVALEMLGEVDPLFSMWPGGRRSADKLRDLFHEHLELLQAQTRTDLGRKEAVVTLAVDLDAAGGAVWGAIVRGASKGKLASAERDDRVESLTIDDAPAFRLKTYDLAWHVRPDGTLLIGSERGLARQLRNTLKPNVDAKSVLAALASRTRKPGVITVVCELPRALKQSAAKTLATLGPLVRELKGAALTTNGSAIEMKLVAESDNGHEALLRGGRALVGLLKASASLIEAGAQAVIGLERLTKRPEIVPKDLDIEDLKELSQKWVEGFTLGAKYSKRPGREVEMILTPSSPRGILAATALLLGYVVPHPVNSGELEARLILMTLRQLEFTYREKKGEFFACGPVPAEVPKGAVEWPAESCFKTLGFKPPGKVRFQVAVSAEGGNLLLVAQGDPDGDGVSEVWVLDETSPTIRPITTEPEAGNAEEPQD